jgi:tetratricopeptide (TPR) repeat protein
MIRCLYHRAYGPSDARLISPLAPLYNDAIEQGNSPRALKYWEKYVTVQRSLLAPGSMELIEMIAILGTLQSNVDMHQACLTSMDEALSLFTQHEPLTEVKHLTLLANTHGSRADALREMGRPSEAEAAYSDVITAWARLPPNEVLSDKLGAANHYLGKLLFERGAQDEARQAAQTAVALFEQEQASSTNMPLILALESLATMLPEKEALPLCERACSLAEANRLMDSSELVFALRDRLREELGRSAPIGPDGGPTAPDTTPQTPGVGGSPDGTGVTGDKRTPEELPGGLVGGELGLGTRVGQLKPPDPTCLPSQTYLPSGIKQEDPFTAIHARRLSGDKGPPTAIHVHRAPIGDAIHCQEAKDEAQEEMAVELDRLNEVLQPCVEQPIPRDPAAQLTGAHSQVELLARPMEKIKYETKYESIQAQRLGNRDPPTAIHVEREAIRCCDDVAEVEGGSAAEVPLANILSEGAHHEAGNAAISTGFTTRKEAGGRGELRKRLSSSGGSVKFASDTLTIGPAGEGAEGGATQSPAPHDEAATAPGGV